MEAQKLQCDGDDGCGGEFYVVALGAAKVKDDIEKVGFICPHCGKEFIAYFTNAGIRSLMELQQEIAAKPRTRRNCKLNLELQARIKVGMERLRREMGAPITC